MKYSFRFYSFVLEFKLNLHVNCPFVGFMRLFGSELKKMGRHLATYFQLKKPTVEPNFEKILKKANSPFVLAVCHVTKDSRKTKLEVSRFRFIKYALGKKLPVSRTTALVLHGRACHLFPLHLLLHQSLLRVRHLQHLLNLERGNYSFR